MYGFGKMISTTRAILEVLEVREFLSVSPGIDQASARPALESVVLPLVRAVGHVGRTPAATVVTDQSAYAPFSTVHIRGSGFTPGASVSIQVLHTDGASNRGRAYLPWLTKADRHGSIAGNYLLNASDVDTALKVTAVQQDRSKLTAVVNFTDAPPPTDQTPPTMPGNFTVTGGTAFSSVTLTWDASTDNVGVTSYRLYRNGTFVATVGASTLTYTDTGLFGSTSYNYTLTAMDAVGNASSAAGFTFVTPTNTGNTPPPVAGNWNQIFSDDFNTLNTTVWTNGKYWWDGNSGTQTTFDPKNAATSGGTLNLTANHVAETDTNHVSQPYNSGLLQTGGIQGVTSPGFSFTYGYVEIRTKIAPGQGMWSAFWMLPVSHQDGYELDVLEILGRDPTTYTAFDHAWPTFGTSVVDHLPFNTTSDFHTYGVDWEPDHVTWFLDGTPVATYSDTAVIPQQAMYLLLNLDVGGDWAGPINGSSPATSAWSVDYVKVFQKA